MVKCDHSSGEERSGWRYRLFAWALAKGSPRYERFVRSRKAELFSDLSGTVLEIGPGTGVNFQYFPKDIRWIGIEPNVHMHDYLRKEAGRCGLEVEIRAGLAENIRLADDSVDAVISSLVLCSVSEPVQVLREIRRVLKPGGRFYFVEHVAARRGTFLRRIQRLIRPIWKRVGDGCHPDRETGRLLEEAGFEEVDYQRFSVPVPVISPHIAGAAVENERA